METKYKIQIGRLTFQNMILDRNRRHIFALSVTDFTCKKYSVGSFEGLSCKLPSSSVVKLLLILHFNQRLSKNCISGLREIQSDSSVSEFLNLFKMTCLDFSLVCCRYYHSFLKKCVVHHKPAIFY